MRRLVLASALLAFCIPAYAQSREGSSDYTQSVQSILPCVVNIGVSAQTGHESHDHDHDHHAPATEPPDSPADLKGSGAGTIISADGLVLTANHILGDAAWLAIRLYDGRTFEGPRGKMVVGTDPDSDIALLRIPLEAAAGSLAGMIATLGDSDGVEVGQRSFAVGHPAGFPWTATFGFISSQGRRNLDFGQSVHIADQDFIQHQTHISPGSSGGPLANEHGEVIGVNVGVNRANGAIAFAVPINQVRPIVTALARYGRPVFPSLGVTGTPAALPDGRTGLRVLSVRPNSAAANEGIRPLDVLLSINGQRVASQEALWRMERRMQEEDVAVVVARDAQEIACNLRPSVVAPTADSVASAKRTPLNWRGYTFAEQDGKVVVLARGDGEDHDVLTPGVVIEQVGLQDVRTLPELVERVGVLGGWTRSYVLTVRADENSPPRYVRF